MRFIQFLILFSPIFAFCQTTELVIKDYDTKSLLPNARILHNHKPYTNADNNAKIKLDIQLKQVEVTAIGYDTTEVILGGSSQIVYLYKKEKKIKEIVIKPVIDEFAHSLIKKMKENYEANHPNRLASYQFMVYSKFSADAKEDTLPNKYKNKKDSTEYIETLDFVKHSKLFIWEKATIFKHSPLGDKKLLQTSAMSGFKQPLYELLALSMDEVNVLPSIFRYNYDNQYFFRLEDSSMINGRKTYQVAFFPYRKFKSKRSRHGYVLIDATNYALIKYQGTTSEGFYELNNQLIQNKCFTKLAYYNSYNSMITASNLNTIAQFVLKVEDIETPKEFTSQEFKGNENEISSTLNDKKSIDLLTHLRGKDTLDKRELNTYNSLDSIIAKEGIDKKLKLLLALRRGYVKVSKVNLSILDLAQVNRYEGLRLQLGGMTNYYFHPKLSLNGYLAYGFKDEQFKGGLGASYLLNYHNNAKIALNYQNDIVPAGREIFDLAHPSERFNHLLNLWFFEKYYQTQNVNLSFQSDLNKYLEEKISVKYSDISTKFPYTFQNYTIQNLGILSTNLNLRFYPKSQYITTPEGKFSIKEKPTQILLNYGFHLPMNSNLSSYHTVTLEGNTTFHSKLGSTKITINTGMTVNDAPIMALYEGFGSSNRNNDLIKTFGLGSYRYFETMEPSTFYSDKYASLFIKHNFPGIKLSTKRYINLSLVYKSLIGELSNPNMHSIALQAPNKLYQEAGFEWDNIIKFLPIGVGFYYRFGAYNYGNFGNNIAGRLLIPLR